MLNPITAAAIGAQRQRLTRLSSPSRSPAASLTRTLTSAHLAWWLAEQERLENPAVAARGLL